MLEKIMESYISNDRAREEEKKEYKIEYMAPETIKLKPAKYSCSTCGSYK